VQARAAGTVRGGLAELRALIRRGRRLRTYLPTAAGAEAWSAAATRVGLPA